MQAPNPQRQALSYTNGLTLRVCWLLCGSAMLVSAVACASLLPGGNLVGEDLSICSLAHSPAVGQLGHFYL